MIDKEGNHLDCRIRGKLRLAGIKSTNPIAVGDEIEFDLEESKNDDDIQIGVIKKILQNISTL